MDSPDESRIGEYEKIVSTAAYRFRNAADYDDLYQEGMIAVWLCPPDADSRYVSGAVYYRLKMWARYIRRQRHHQVVNYDEAVQWSTKPT
jgi:DNA-directed RNA polymerase specialized sigma24 family protein